MKQGGLAEVQKQQMRAQAEHDTLLAVKKAGYPLTQMLVGLVCLCGGQRLCVFVYVSVLESGLRG